MPFAFASRDEKKNDFGVLALQGSFDIVHDEALRPQQEQADMVFDDEYIGEVAQSTLIQENNIAPFKPKTDIHVNATAYAPGGKPKNKWLVSVTLGKLYKQLLITGPRCWERSITFKKHLDEPEPIQKLPIQYEYAYGGAVNDDEGKVQICESNPIGLGFEQKFHSYRNTAANMAPQIIRQEDYDMQSGKDYPPQGLSPIPPNWSQRLTKAGTYDLVWEKTRWPDLPEDFSFEFYNSAHPDLIYPGYVNGDEDIELHNLTAEGHLKTALPNYSLAILVRYEDGELRPIPMVLDTIYLDVNNMQAKLTWRAIYSLEKNIRVLEARIQLPENKPVEEKDSTEIDYRRKQQQKV